MSGDERIQGSDRRSLHFQKGSDSAVFTCTSGIKRKHGQGQEEPFQDSVIFSWIGTLVGPEPQFRFRDRGDPDFTDPATSDVLPDLVESVANQKNTNVCVEEKFHNAKSRS